MYIAVMIHSILLIATGASAQSLVTGIVRDAVTDVPLPEVTVQEENGFQATVSNSEGRFEILVASFPSTLVFSRIGYSSHRLLLSSDEATVQSVMLVPAVFDLDPVIVTEHESAEDIMRRVIERKQSWRTRLHAVRAEAYSRFTLANDTSVVFILEALADASWDQENGWKAVVKSYRRSSTVFTDDDTDDLKTMDGMSEGALVLNLYDDDIELVDHHLMGVTHPEALNKYKFQMAGQRLLDDRLVYDITVEPRSKLFSGFEGRISVLDREYAMIEADLKPGEAFFFPPPVQDLQMKTTQQFAKFGDGYWLPVGMRMSGDLKIGIVGFAFPTIKAVMVARFSSYSVVGTSATTPGDSLIIPEPVKPPENRLVEEGLNDSLLVQQGKIIPLSTEERATYDNPDSSLTFIKAFEPTGFIAGIMKRRGVFDEENRRNEDAEVRDLSLSGNRTGKGNSDSRPLSFDMEPAIRYNRVEAAHLGAVLESKMRKTPLTFRVEGGYNTGTERWFYGGGFEWQMGRRSRHTIFTSYLNGSEPRYESALYNSTMASMPSLLGQSDYFDFMLNEKVNLGYRYRIRNRRRIAVSAALNVERHQPLPKRTDFALFGISRTQRPNPAIAAGNLRSIAFEFQFGEKPSAFSPERFRHIAIRSELSHPDLLQSQFDFSRTRLALAWRVNTLFERRMLPNTLDIRLTGGFTTGAPPIQRFGILDGAIGGSSQYGVFRSLPGQPYEGQHYAGFFWDHNFRTIPFEILGLESFSRRGIGVSVFGGHGRTWLSKARLASLAYVPRYQNSLHHELGLSVTGLFYLFRLDMTTRIDRPGFFLNIGIGPGFME